ncbi:MAG TPA: hypothetical protein VJI32_06325, partial [Candidatus Nanoarchaeia archaeon]|nr:hypothetical protein [Candidatus Nanoarchaeia archaeon]
KKIIILLIALLLLIGCGSDSGDRALTYNFKQGMSELDVSFLDNAPPERIYPTTPFKIIVTLDNQAAYDVTAGTVHIVGLDEHFFRVDQQEQFFDLIEGRSALAPSGGKQFLEFDAAAGELFQNAEEYVNTFFVKVRYNSKMDFQDTICINPNLYAVYDAGCKVEDSKGYSGQGAPLAVQELEEIMSPGGSVELRLHVRNEGQGKINTVYMGSTLLGGEELPCEFQNAGDNKKMIVFTAQKQEATLICRKLLRDQNSYSTPLSVGFSYDYEVKEEGKLRMVR